MRQGASVSDPTYLPGFSIGQSGGSQFGGERLERPVRQKMRETHAREIRPHALDCRGKLLGSVQPNEANDHIATGRQMTRADLYGAPCCGECAIRVTLKQLRSR